MTSDLIVFIALAIISILAAIGLLTSRNAIYAALFLILNFSTVAVLYLMLNAPFLAVIQISVYAGAIMVLFLFVIWLLNLQTELRSAPGYLALKTIAGLLCAALAAELFVLLGYAPTAGGAKAVAPAGYGSIEMLATTLFSDYLVSFEITSVLLLAAIVGAIALARRAPSPQATGAEAVAAAGAPARSEGA